MLWTSDDLTPLDIEIDEAEDQVVVFTVGTPAGQIRLIAEVTENNRSIVLSGAHIDGPGPNVIGIANLRLLAQVIMEALDYDGIDIQGASRTTGAGPREEHRPRFRFTRRRASGVPG